MQKAAGHDEDVPVQGLPGNCSFTRPKDKQAGDLGLSIYIAALVHFGYFYHVPKNYPNISPF